MKKWLDNYGKKENANEGRSSAPKEWIGEGYSTQGRNYSPAWGGQFRDGGEIPQAQNGWLEKLTSTLNPYNWRVEDYSKEKDFTKAYSTAKKAGEEEFMYKGKRYNTKYAGTPRQEVGTYGVDGKPVHPMDLNHPAQVNLYPAFGKYLPGHISASVKDNETSIDYSRTGNYPFGIFNQVKNKGEKSFNVYGQDNLTFSNKASSLPTGDYMLEGKYTPSDWNLFTNNCADNVCDAFGIPTSKGIQTPSGAVSKIKKKYPTLDVTGKTYEDYYDLSEKLQSSFPEKILPQAKNILGIASSPDLKKLKPKFISSIQQALYESGYELPKSKLKNNNNFDGILGDETKTALLDWQKKNKSLAMGGSIPGSVGFTYARTNSPAPSEGPYAKKTLPSAQNGKVHKKYLPEKVENWVEPKYVEGLNSEGHYGYNGRDTINYDPNSEVENINNPWWLEHEKYHHLQTLSGRNPKERRQQEIDNQVNEMIKSNPGLQFIPKNKLISGSKPNEKGQKSFVGAEDLIYENPSTLEGEARLYEDYISSGGKSIFPKQENGGMTYYQHGLDWKPKNISKNGGWLEKYETPQAQTGYTFPSYQMPRAASESTSLGVNKVNVAAENQARINRAREKQGSIRQAEAPRSAASKALAIATHPMTALAYKAKGQDIPEHFERGETNPLEYATDVINPVTYLNAVGRTAHNITSPKEMLYRTLNSIEGDDNMLGVVGDALLTAGFIGPAANLSKVGLRKSVDLVSPVGRELRAVEKYGRLNNLTEAEIKNMQMQKIGITSKQREGYFPGASEILSEYLTPYGYDNMGKRLLNIPKRIIKGETNVKKVSDNLVDVVMDQGQTLLSKPRYDAWRMYSGLPQEYGTFRLAETSPLNHSSYPKESLNNIEIFSLNDERRLLNDVPNKNDLSRYHYSNEDLVDDLDYLKRSHSDLDKLNNSTKIYATDFGTTNVMGGHNRRFFDNKMEYNDIWDLNPGNLKVDKYFGKPFMSHGQVPYNINDIQSELRNFIKQGEKLKEYPNIKTNIYKNKLLTDKLNNLNNSIPNYSTVVKKQKEGGIIEDDRGQWAHPGKITKINSNQITMKGVDYPVLGISDAGDQQMMYPEQEYTFKGKKVTEFPMAQDGTRMPIYTTDPKKIQAYADSLALHNISLNRFNLTKKFAETLGKGKDYNKSVLAQKAANDAELWRTDVTNSYNNLSSLNKKEPTPVERIENIPLSEQEKKGWDIHGIYSAELYKKPVQPYILKKEEEPTLKRKPVKVETIKSKSASTPGLKTIPGTPVEQQPVPQRGEYRVSYYNPDIKDWSEQAFQTEKESEKFASEMSGRGYGGSYGNVTQTRKVNKKENGGWLSQYK